jgi:hypothetical protein
MAELLYKKLLKQYRPDLPPALDRLDLNIRDGEFVAFLGPHGLWEIDDAADDRGPDPSRMAR